MDSLRHKMRIGSVLAALIVLWALMAALPDASGAGETVRLHFFMSRECPHCKAEKAFLADLEKKYPELDIVQHVVTEIPADAQLFVRMSEAYGIKVGGVPATFIGNFEPIVGFRDAATTGAVIESQVRYCAEHGCIDPIDKVQERPSLIEPAPVEDLLTDRGRTVEEGICPDNIPCVEGEGTKPVSEEPEATVSHKGEIEQSVPASAPDAMLDMPLIGTVDASKMALPVLTITIAALDGFNPCAFFVLFTLLGMLVHVHSRRKMLLVGGIFVFFSGFIYFLFMAAWLNIFLLSGEMKVITLVAGVMAFMIAVINIKEYFYFKRGISLSIPDSAKPKLFERMRHLLKASSLASIIVGTVVLAIAANAYELLCTAGFPMVFTRILTLHDLSSASYYLYLVFYNIVYVIPLATIVILFTITLGSRKLSEHQGQILKLISGMMMLFLALVILIKPALLSNIAVAGGLLIASLAVSGLIILTMNILDKRK